MTPMPQLRPSTPPPSHLLRSPSCSSSTSSSQTTSTTSSPNSTNNEQKRMATLHTERGNTAFLSGDYSVAIQSYKGAAKILSNMPFSKIEFAKTWADISECHMRQMDWQRAEKSATWAIEADESNVKAWFCRAKARFLCGSDYAGAVSDASRALENAEGQMEVEEIRKLLGVAQARKKILEKCVPVQTLPPSRGGFPTKLMPVPRFCHDYVDDEESILTEDEWEKEIEWWESPPFCPQDNSYENMKLLAQFRRRFGIIPPYDRMSLERAFKGGWGRNDYIDVVELLLSQKFGKKANNLAPDQFARYIRVFEMSVEEMLLRKFGREKMEKEGKPKHPTDWHFDHYGTLCALVHAAFASLPKEYQENADVQSRLAEATLTGWEDTLTEEIALNDDKSWYGPAIDDKMPQSWQSGDGIVLMEKAWQIWIGTQHARELAYEAEACLREDAEDTADLVLALCETALELPCLMESALTSAEKRSHTSNANTGWDCVGDILDVYARIICCYGSAYLDLGQAEEALRLFNKPETLVIGGSSRVRLLLIKAEVLSHLKRYQNARDCLRESLRIVEEYRKTAPSDEVVLSAEYEEATSFLNRLKDLRGPLPSNKPVPSTVNEGWWIFDACTWSEEIYNALGEGEQISVGTWCHLACPQIEKLHVKIGGHTKLTGLSTVFPNVKELVIDDSSEDYRVCYDLEPLKGLSSTLTHLELRLSFQWMCEGSDVLAPLADLLHLKQLYVSRLRDGHSEALKAIEKMHNLEHLFFEGSNRTKRLVMAGGRDVAPRCPLLLDLSELTKLKSAVLAEANFCSELELRTDIQALRLPDNLKKLTCVEVHYGFGDCTTKALRSELARAGVELHVIYAPASRNSNSVMGCSWRKSLLEGSCWYKLPEGITRSPRFQEERGFKYENQGSSSIGWESDGNAADIQEID